MCLNMIGELLVISVFSSASVDEFKHAHNDINEIHAELQSDVSQSLNIF